MACFQWDIGRVAAEGTIRERDRYAGKSERGAVDATAAGGRVAAEGTADQRRSAAVGEAPAAARGRIAVKCTIRQFCGAAVGETAPAAGGRIIFKLTACILTRIYYFRRYTLYFLTASSFERRVLRSRRQHLRHREQLWGRVLGGALWGVDGEARHPHGPYL